MRQLTINSVIEFCRAFQVRPNPSPALPDISDDDHNALCVSLIQEELEELQDALATKDEVEVLDALADLQYVVDYAFVTLGFGPMKEAAFAEVHASNMSKLGADGKPIFNESGKVMKGPTYFKPDIERILTTAVKLFRQEQQ